MNRVNADYLTLPHYEQTTILNTKGIFERLAVWRIGMFSCPVLLAPTPATVSSGSSPHGGVVI